MKIKITILTCLTVLLLAACSGSSGDEPAAGPTPTETATPGASTDPQPTKVLEETPTVIAVVSVATALPTETQPPPPTTTQGVDLVNTETPTPTQSPTPSVTPTPTEAANCLVGVWQATNFEEYMRTAMGEVDDVELTITGTVQLTITETEMIVEGLDFSIEIATMGVSMPIDISMDASGTYEADGEFITGTGGEVNINTSVGADTSMGLFSGEPRPYTCEGNILTMPIPEVGASIVYERVS